MQEHARSILSLEQSVIYLTHKKEGGKESSRMGGGTNKMLLRPLQNCNDSPHLKFLPTFWNPRLPGFPRCIRNWVSPSMRPGEAADLGERLESGHLHCSSSSHSRSPRPSPPHFLLCTIPLFLSNPGSGRWCGRSDWCVAREEGQHLTCCFRGWEVLDWPEVSPVSFLYFQIKIWIVYFLSA